MMNKKIGEMMEGNQINIDLTVEGIKDLAHLIKKDMEALITDIEKNGENAMINSLGVIQGRGSEIDNKCGQLYSFKKTKSMLKEVQNEEIGNKFREMF